ncbi:hypothetical protein HTG_17610 [Natrinema mahii]|nr:hypothetical protein HTG_17610 [Natrinema mahii]
MRECMSTTQPGANTHTADSANVPDAMLLLQTALAALAVALTVGLGAIQSAEKLPGI